MHRSIARSVSRRHICSDSAVQRRRAGAAAVAAAKREDETADELSDGLRVAMELSPKTITAHYAPKLKSKTRPILAVEDGDQAPPSAIEQDVPAEQRLIKAVMGESKATADLMFAGYGMAGRLTRWEHVVSALVDAGCSAVTGSGSAVTLTDARNLRGPTVFHRPHPDPSVDSIMLRSVGKQLRKWFGWDAETFSERK